MAGIDKTYTDNYEDYRKFKDWADKQVVTFFDGYSLCIGDWIWELDKECFNKGEVPIMNTTTWLDIYLIQNCKVQFVLDRMNEVYDTKEYKNVDLSARPPEDYKQNRKIRISRCKSTKFPIHSKPYGGKNMWWLQCSGDFRYNEYTKRWVHYNNHYPNNTNTAHISSIKTVVRHLRKQYLPKGVEFRLLGNYVGENYTITIH